MDWYLGAEDASKSGAPLGGNRLRLAGGVMGDFATWRAAVAPPNADGPSVCGQFAFGQVVP
jgi:hypothetical protein